MMETTLARFRQLYHSVEEANHVVEKNTQSLTLALDHCDKEVKRMMRDKKRKVTSTPPILSFSPKFEQLQKDYAKHCNLMMREDASRREAKARTTPSLRHMTAEQEDSVLEKLLRYMPSNTSLADEDAQVRQNVRLQGDERASATRAMQEYTKSALNLHADKLVTTINRNNDKLYSRLIHSPPVQLDMKVPVNEPGKRRVKLPSVAELKRAQWHRLREFERRRCAFVRDLVSLEQEEVLGQAVHQGIAQEIQEGKQRDVDLRTLCWYSRLTDVILCQERTYPNFHDILQPSTTSNNSGQQFINH